jgi:hypothetical protein
MIDSCGPSDPPLLVSLTGPEEVDLAIASGIRWLDLKDPSVGPLGAPNPSVAASYLERARQRANEAILSVALGELMASTPMPLERIACEFDFAKVALAGCARIPEADWIAQARQWRDRFPTPGHLILVHYADHQLAAAPTWEQVVEVAHQLHGRWVLIDTFDKSAGRLRSWYDNARLAQCVALARQKGLRIALAGSLARDDVRDLRMIGADLLAVRGAACANGQRTAKLCKNRLDSLVSLFPTVRSSSERVFRKRPRASVRHHRAGQ